MNFSEFKRLLGADPRSEDPAFLAACQSTPEFEREARDALQFENKLDQALAIPEPPGLVDNLLRIAEQPPSHIRSRRLPPIALAASLFVAVGAAGIVWKMNTGWDSVEEYLVDHYRHDGASMMTRTMDGSISDVQAILSDLSVRASPQLAEIVGVIKYCPTPDGQGVHMILKTDTGPVTVFYMPHTAVTDGETFAFDEVEAVLVELKSGSAAIIAPDATRFSGLQALIYESLLPLPGNS